MLEIIIKLPKRMSPHTAEQVLGRCAQRVHQRALDTGVAGHAVLHGMGGRRYRVYWQKKESEMGMSKGSGFYGSVEMVGTEEGRVSRFCEDETISTVEYWRKVIEQRVAQLTAQIDAAEHAGDDDAVNAAAQRQSLQWALDIQAAPIKTLKHVAT